MGFMQGFAKGFSESFSQAQNEKAVMKRDTLRMVYDDFLSRKKEIEELKREDEKRIKLAKALVEGQELPEGSWIKAYEWLSSGMSPPDVSERLRDQESFVSRPSELPAGEITPKTKPSEESFVEEPEEISQTKKLFGFPKKIFGGDDTQSQIEFAVREISKSTGVPEETVRKTIMGEGFTSSVTPDMIAQAPEYRPIESVSKDLPASYAKAVTVANRAREAYDRNPSERNRRALRIAEKDVRSWEEAIRSEAEIQNPKDELRREQLFKLGEAIRKPLQDYNVQKNLAISLIRDVRDIQKIVEENQGVLAKTTAEGATFITEISQNIKAAMDILRSGDKEKIQDIELEYERLKQNSIAQGVIDLSTARTLLDMKTQLMAYKLGMIYQQEGRSFAEAEREMFIRMSQAGNSEIKFLQNMAVLVDGELRRIEDNRKSVENDFSVRAYKREFGELQEPLTESVYEIINKNEDLKEVIEKLQKYRNVSTKFIREQEEESLAKPGSSRDNPVVVNSIEEAENLPRGTFFILNGRPGVVE